MLVPLIDDFIYLCVINITYPYSTNNLCFRTDNLLVPIAIQLGQKHGPDFPIWTPKDEPLDWLLAKVCFLAI